ncbi:hypothetical protein Y032_0001g102 [Ancylostoma ceylanicum]|uniref:Nucleoside transporter n=1 Tax=Ancylostoma ceylanicum TaxID=53326 RepID=A0A016W1R7_9BILA|nr:hypothetical protein Y032_0001g102 [Ancylostoma ceylanicum]
MTNSTNPDHLKEIYARCVRLAQSPGRGGAGADDQPGDEPKEEAPDQGDANPPPAAPEGQEPSQPQDDKAAPKQSAEGGESSAKPGEDAAKKESGEVHPPPQEPTSEEMKEKWDSKSRASKEGTKKEGEPEGEPPVDKFWFAFMIIMLNGIGVLLPWNMFITIAPNYYVQYWFTMDGNRTDYAKRFMSDLGIAAQTPNFLAGLINVMQIIGGSLMIRIAGPLSVNCVNVAVILILIVAQDPAEEAMGWFYIVTMLIVVILNFSNGLYQNSVFGLTADFPAAYTNALIVGNNVCGTFISVLVIVTTIAFPTQYKTVALIYFSISLAVLLLCGASLFSLTRLVSASFRPRNNGVQ